MKKTSKIIFTTSILLNLTLIGFIGTHEYKKYQRHDFSHQVHEKSKMMMRQNMNISESDMRQKMNDIHQKRRDLKNVIEAPEFDLIKYNELTAVLLAQKDEMERGKAVAMGTMMSELSYEERQKFAGQILSKMNKKNKFKGSGDKPRHSN